MKQSDSFSEHTNSTFPIIVSFSSNLRSKRIKKIQDFLQLHPNCRKYITKGPNFVADGNNEFRLYYVDSSLYTDETTLKRLNVEKEEIVFASSSEDSLEPSAIASRKKSDKGVMCKENIPAHGNMNNSIKSSKDPILAERISKSFQIGPDLRFNVVYVNTEPAIFPAVQNKNFIEKSTQTCNDLKLNQKCPKILQKDSENSSFRYQIRESPSFICDKNEPRRKPEKQKLSTFKTFCAKMEEKIGYKRMTDDSEVNVETRTTSLDFSIKKSPSFVASYIWKVLKKKKSNGELVESEIFERSIVNYGDVYEVAVRNDRITRSTVRTEHERSKNRRTTRETSLIIERNRRRKINRKESNAQSQVKRCYKLKPSLQNSARIVCLFRCTNMDFFYRRSHYAILKKYHRKLKHHRHKRHRRRERLRNCVKENCQLEKPKKVPLHIQDNRGRERKKQSTGDSRTRTTISGFLHSFKPWHWQDSSKLSVCLDDDCFTEETNWEDDTHFKTSGRRFGISQMKHFR